MSRIYLPFFLATVSFVTGCATTSSPDSRPQPQSISLDIQVLVEKARDGSTVKIPSGEYRLPDGITIRGRKGLVLTAEPGTRLLVEDTNADVLSIQQCEGIRIENLYLRHTKPLKKYECHGTVVSLDESRDTKIVNCELNGCGAIGVSAWKSKNVLISNCFIHHNTFNAFYFYGCDDVNIRSNIVEDNGNFIQMYDTQKLEMQNNVLRRNKGYWKRSIDSNPGLLK